MLPGINGYELLEYLRPIGVPVSVITARNMVEDRIAGLKLGADDYIAKPFQLGEVLARIEAVLRRSAKPVSIINIDDLELDVSSRTVRKSGKEIQLTTKEFDLLLMLYENKNVALYREQLYEKVWNEPFMGNTRTLDSHIQRLRKKLNWNDRIKTVFRIGYRLEV
jgi:DNA-binding response OmpR family regulator